MSHPLARRPIESVSVLVPTLDGGALFERVLDALRRQVCPLPFDVRVVDSGSTDGTRERLRRAAVDFPVPFTWEAIHPDEFDHGDTRNRLVARSPGDLCVFLTQDAIPVGDDWLARLARNFDDPSVAAAYCRNVPRADADPVTRVLSAQDPGYRAASELVRAPADWATLDPHARRLHANFNDVASAVRREVWERCPFPRTSFGEDILLAHALLEAGWTIAYDADAAVEHSHDYDVLETRARARIDGEFNRVWLDRVCVGSASDARALTRRFEEPDRAALADLGLAGRELDDAARRARARRRAAFEGLVEGGRATRSATPPRVLADTRLRVLFVVHGFPPEQRAGTEVYTLHLAQALARRGHAVTVLARGEHDPQREEPHLVEEEVEGLRVLRLRRALDHASFRATWDDPRIDALFDALLERERFDVAHFQHLIHLSVGLVERARARGLATIAHLHDYWGLCARVQLIRPDRTICPTNRGLGCLACVKERHVERVPALARVGPFVRPLLAGLAAVVGANRPGERSRRTFLQRNLADFSDLDQRGGRILGALASADLCVSPSRFLRTKVLATGHFDAQRLVYSPNGLRVDALATAGAKPPSGDDSAIHVGFVGSLVWYKGLDVLLAALEHVTAGALRLHVHGAFDPAGDPHHAELRERARDLPVEFHGPFGDAERAAVYAGLDVLVVPSIWYENAPVTIHEAWHTDTPVVASRLGGMAELVRDGHDGFLFEAGDARDLARCLERFVTDPRLARRLGANTPRVKTIDEDASDAEFRYRGLVARRR